MKKIISAVATIALTSTAALPLIGCGAPDNILKIAFVPSKDPVAMLKIVRPLENLLKNKIKKYLPRFNKSIKITTTTDYQAAGQALQDGKTALAFLPMGTYLDYRGKEDGVGNYTDAAPLVVAQRRAMIPDTKTGIANKRVIDLQEQIKAISSYNDITKTGIVDKKDAYKKFYHEIGDGNVASFYRSEVVVNNDFLKEEVDKGLKFDDPSSYKQNIKQLIINAKAKGNNKVELLKSNTSGAGVIYPVKWMLDNDFELNLISEILRGQARADSYTQAMEHVANGASLIAFGYADVRSDVGDIKKNYANTTMVGLTDGIPNDGIAYSKKVIKDLELLSAIRQAFKALINERKNAEIFEVYTHTDYLTPDENATPEQVLQWEINQNKNFNNANQSLAKAIEIIKASSP